MKKRKGSLLQKITAMLLSAALFAGMVQGAVPVDVLAKGNADSAQSIGIQESVSENAVKEPALENLAGTEPGNAAETETVSANMLSDELMAIAAVTAVPGAITADEEWDAQTLEAGTYTIHPGVTVTVTGALTVNGDVTITGGGKLVRGSETACFTVPGGNLTLQNIEIDGASLSSSNTMITATGSGKVTLGPGCRIHHCYKNENTGYGAVLNLSGSSAVFQEAVIENCQSKNYGGAIYMAGGSSLTIYSGTYRENCTTYSTSSYGGGFIYNRASRLEIYGGSFINNTSEGRGGCIYNAGISDTETYLYGGYFQGNRSAYTGTSGEGSGAVFYSSENTADTIINLSGNVQFCGDGVTGSGTDGVFLGFASNAVRKAQISSELKYPLALYLAAEEGRVIAQGVNGYTLQKKDMKKISFTDVGSSGTVWYAKLDEANNQIILTTTDPGYHYYVTYVGNGGEGDVSDSREYSDGDTVTVQPGDSLRRDGYSFGGWNTRADGMGTAYRAGETFQITDDVTLYAQWIAGHKVTYDYSTNGGSSATQSSVEAGAGDRIDLTPTAKKTGWEFVGWNTNKDAHEGLTSLRMGESDITLYAIYKRTLTAAFYSGSVNSSEKLTTTIYNRDVYGSVNAPALKPWAEPAESGYRAKDWLQKGTTNVYSPGNTVKLTEDTSFYGRYSKTITISYDANGGTGSVAEQTVDVKATVNDRNVDYEEVSVILKDGTGLGRAGYTFGGWYDNEDCTGTAVTSLSGVITGNRKYFAKWTDNIAPVIGALEYSYQPKNLWQQLIGKESLVVKVPVTEEGSGAGEITYTVTPDGGTASSHRAAIRNGLAEITVSADFKGTIAITCTDHAGNTSAGITVGAGLNATGIIIEDNAPQITFKADDHDVSADEYDSSPDLTVTVTDDKDNAISAGIASISYQIGDGEETLVQRDFTTVLTTESSFVIAADEIPLGETMITVTAVDNAGNRNTAVQSIRVHRHSFASEWTSDGRNHWHGCACGEKSGAAAHNFGEWITDKEATESEEGQKHRTCQTCSYEEREVIPALGTIDTDVETDHKAPVTQIFTPADELADMLLTEEEKQETAGGTNIRIILAVKDASENVSSEDKALVETALNGYAMGQYLDISLYKLVGESRTDITKTPGKIAITITIPDSLKNTDSQKTRTFAVIRVHDGLTELLADTDSSADTITIETDRFSTYAIVYKDRANDGGNGNGSNDDGNDTDDNNGGGNNDGNDTDDNDGSGNNNSGSNDGNNSSGGNDSNSNGSSTNNNSSSNNGHDNNNNGGGNNDGGSNNGNNGSGGNDSNSNGSSANNNSNSNAPGNTGSKTDTSKDNEPKTGDAVPLELYATLAMIAGFAYLRLYFSDRIKGMTEETKKELVSGLVAWAKRGGRLRKCLAIAAIFVLLVYYHSVGKKICGEWKEVYGE